MTCPNCEKHSVCSCNSCKARRNMSRCRTEKVVKAIDSLKCPYCKNVFYIGLLEDLAYKEYVKEEKNKIN